MVKYPLPWPGLARLARPVLPAGSGKVDNHVKALPSYKKPLDPTPWTDIACNDLNLKPLNNMSGANFFS